jgi:hypothetical protein
VRRGYNCPPLDTLAIYSRCCLLQIHFRSAGTAVAVVLNWLVKDKKIAPHIPVIDKSKRQDGTFNRDDFQVRQGAQPLYMASVRHCRSCPLKAQCCPKAAFPSGVTQHLRGGS